MPRPLRPVFAGAVYHLGTTGVSRCAGAPSPGRARKSKRRPLERCLVYTDDVDRERFLELLARTVIHRGWRCHTYCLMGTHYHLLVETPDPDVSAGLQYLNGCYAQWFNRRHRRRGHLFGARFWGELVANDSHLLELSRYIVRNPVRAGLCTHPIEWRWSSYGAMIGARPQPLFLTTGWLLEQFAAQRPVARERYRAWVAAGGRQRLPLAA